MVHRSVRVLAVAAVCAGLLASVAGVTVAEVSKDEQQVMLGKHNSLRTKVAADESARLGQTVSIPKLTWNADAAAIAQAWADHLLATDTFEHNPDTGGLGENIYWESGFDPSTGAKRAFHNWASEQDDYTWDTNSCAAGKKCGHYTQIVWSGTTSVGCGMATDGTQAYWVCDYAPAGNVQGQRPYEPGAGATGGDAGTGGTTGNGGDAGNGGTAPSAAPVQPGASVAPIVAVPSLAPDAAPPADPNAAMLGLHNTFRQGIAAAETARLGQAVTIPDLTWDPAAAAIAQGWADTMLRTGDFKHNKKRGPYGENIYFESGSDPATSFSRAFASWANEQTAYSWDTNSCAEGQTCGHYTQLAWQNTWAVGCGSATDGTTTYWVCDYAPPGNVDGQRPYEPGVVPVPPVAASAEPSQVPVDQPVPSVVPDQGGQPAESPAPDQGGGDQGGAEASPAG
ncbi:MAG: CAP domain-containing protein [Chloroflexota bacterium]